MIIFDDAINFLWQLTKVSHAVLLCRVENCYYSTKMIKLVGQIDRKVFQILNVSIRNNGIYNGNMVSFQIQNFKLTKKTQC